MYILHLDLNSPLHLMRMHMCSSMHVVTSGHKATYVHNLFMYVCTYIRICVLKIGYVIRIRIFCILMHEYAVCK